MNSTKIKFLNYRSNKRLYKFSLTNKFMQKEKVSFVIKCRNSENTIKLCLNSVLNQSRPADEVIVVDDGSTDNTKKILETYKKKEK